MGPVRGPFTCVSELKLAPKPAPPWAGGVSGRGQNPTYRSVREFVIAVEWHTNDDPKLTRIDSEQAENHCAFGHSIQIISGTSRPSEFELV